MAVDVILNALPKIRSDGKSKWRAPCPVHDGKNLNLMISERPDGSVGCYCFVCGANGLAVVDALSVDRQELFAPDDGYERPAISREMLITEAQDKLVIAMAMNQKDSYMTLQDKRRLKLAKERLQGIEELKTKYSQKAEAKVNRTVDQKIPF